MLCGFLLTRDGKIVRRLLDDIPRAKLGLAEHLVARAVAALGLPVA